MGEWQKSLLNSCEPSPQDGFRRFVLHRLYPLASVIANAQSVYALHLPFFQKQEGMARLRPLCWALVLLALAVSTGHCFGEFSASLAPSQPSLLAPSPQHSLPTNLLQLLCWLVPQKEF